MRCDKLICMITQKFCRECAKTTTDRVATHWWLAKGGLGADTEARVIAPQDGVTETRRAYEV